MIRSCPELTEEVLRTKYLVEKKTQKQIAEEFNTEQTIVSYRMKRWGTASRREYNKPKDITNQRFGKLVALERVGTWNSRSMWLCKCDCGKTKRLAAKWSMGGTTKSCGCSQYDGAKRRKKGCGVVTGTVWQRVRCSAFARGTPLEVTPKSLNELAEKQNYRCALSGLPLLFDVTKQERKEGGQTASLDRINSDDPYTDTNVQWVHKVINLMKQRFSQEEFVFFCRAVARYQDWLDSGCEGEFEPILPQKEAFRFPSSKEEAEQ